MKTKKLKRAETSSSVGAGILGCGIGVLVAGYLEAVALPLVILGLFLHSWGMYDKHRLEQAGPTEKIWWAEALYWGCWLGLLGIIGYVIRVFLN